jgi:hypothetical protein
MDRLGEDYDEDITLLERLRRVVHRADLVRQLPANAPAVAAGVTDHVWKIDEIIALLDEAERAVPIKRGPYKKRRKAAA